MSAADHLFILDSKPDTPNEATLDAIEEGSRITSDPTIKGYADMEELKAVLEA